MKDRLFSYNYQDTPIHRLSGLTKLISFMVLTFSIMFSYDIRIILGALLFSVIVLWVARITFGQIKLMILYVLIFLLINLVITFLFSPEQGVEIYGTRHEIVKLSTRYTLTQEQLFYQVTKFFKYLSVIPLGIIFLFTTNPSEFASSMNKVGLHYKAAYAFSLTLRYFPDVQRVYHDISQAQQARGLEMTSKTSLGNRFKNSLMVLMPLIFSTLDRIEVITNAMDLRGFGKEKKRTWYIKSKLNRGDFIALAVTVLIMGITIFMSVFVNHGRFYNPFI